MIHVIDHHLAQRNRPLPQSMFGAFRIHIDTGTPERLRWTGTYTRSIERVAA